MSPSKSTTEFHPLFGSLFENSPDGVILGEPDGTALRANPAACRMLGRSEKEVVRLGRSGVVVEDAALREWVAARNRDGVAKGVLRYRKADGTVFPVDVTSAVVPGPEGKERAYVIFRDITEQTRAQEALDRSEARMARVLEGSSDGFGDLDVATGCVSVTPRYCEIYGLPPHLKEISVEALMAFVEPADLPPIQADMAAIAAGQKDTHVWEYRIRRADGTTRWIQSRGSVVGRDATGRPGHVSGAITDVTGRVLAERALRASHERMRRAEEVARFGHWEFSIGEGIMHASEGAARVYGLARTDVPLADVQGRVLAEYRPSLDEALRDLIEHDAPYDQEFKIRRDSDGAIVDIHSRAEFDAHTGRVFGVIQDVTERRKAEEALAASERLYRSLIDVSPSAIVIIRDGRLELVNRALLNASGYDRPDQLVGKALADVLTPESSKRVGARIASMQAGGKVGTAEVQVLAKDGSVRLMEAASALCPDERGPVIQVALRDITEQRAMQEKLQVASRLAALGTLVAGVAHEINNPLSGTISGQGLVMEYLLELRDRVSRKEALDLDALVRDLDEQMGALADAQAGAQRIARIVKDLATFGRPDPIRARIHLIDVVEESVRWLAGSVTSSATIQVENREGPDVVASSGQMGQVLVNLITNATKSIGENPHGIITIRVGPGRPGTACVEVTDNGSGMPPEVMARIFDPFFTTREVGQGTGLGLSISHAIVTAHGGTITVESEVGKGATFRVELPAAPAEA